MTSMTDMGGFEIGDKLLITTDNWFYAPDGRLYRAVFGELKAIHSDSETLGIKTNARSTNWYVSIGNVVIAGCQIHYAVKTDNVNTDGYFEERFDEEKKVFVSYRRASNIYVAQ